MKNDKILTNEHKFFGEWYIFFIIFITILVCIPLIVIGIYNHPSADDYVYAILTHKGLD